MEGAVGVNGAAEVHEPKQFDFLDICNLSRDKHQAEIQGETLQFFIHPDLNDLIFLGNWQSESFRLE